MKNKDKAYKLLTVFQNKGMGISILYLYDLWTLICTIRAHVFCSYFYDNGKFYDDNQNTLFETAKSKCEKQNVDRYM